MARLAVLAGVLVLLNLSDAALAQARLSGADLQGEVRDESGGLLVGATVTVVNKETNVGRKIETDDRGQFRALGLPPGTYQVTVVRHDFKTSCGTGSCSSWANRRHSTSRCRWRSPGTKSPLSRRRQ